MEKLLATLEKKAVPLGFDIVRKFSVQNYNSLVKPQYWLPTYGRQNSTLGILIGNTKTLWPIFLDHLRQTQDWDECSNPLDNYTRSSICRIIAEVSSGCSLDIRFSDQAEKNIVAFQRLGHLTGSYLNEIVHLNIDTTYGAWIAWRAAVSLDLEGPPVECLSQPRNPSPGTDTILQEKMEHLLSCMSVTAHSIMNNWREWVDVRDLASGFLGNSKEWKYSEDQIEYHYTRNLDVLRRCLQ